MVSQRSFFSLISAVLRIGPTFVRILRCGEADTVNSRGLKPNSAVFSISLTTELFQKVA